MTDEKTDQRNGLKPRYRALCCVCGELRTVARSYRGKKPPEAEDPDPTAAPWCRWLKCSSCRIVTLHAVIADAVTDGSRRDGCPMERHNRLLDRCRRRIERRLTIFAAEGITVRRRTAPEDMEVDDALLEILEYGDTRRLEIRLSRAAPPHQLLRAIEEAEEIIDEPTDLGPWNVTSTGRWRGLALRQ